MPPRIARASLPTATQPTKLRSSNRNPKKAAKRALNAFSIAQHENPEKVKIRRHRLGEIEQTASTRKRTRDEDEDDEGDDDEDDEPRRSKRRTGDESYDEGSDSEGNTWQMGHVDDDDDEDIDSDEAFGESDEERFEGFTFRGSSKGAKKPIKKKGREEDADSDMSLDEGDSADGEEEEDDFGDEGIDLATALDQYEEDEREEKREKERKRKKVDAFGGSDESEDSEPSDADSDDEDEDRQAQLKDLISSLATQEEEKSRGRRAEVHESAVPDEFGVVRKVDLLSFKPKVVNEEKKRALKLLRDDKTSKRNDIARKLDAPLPKRQQDKLGRAAANEKANETLERWTDTIKRNRRAENLVFPLQNKSGGEPVGEKTLQPTTTSAPANELESTIQAILQQSGLSNGKEDEEKIQKWEELQTNKLPIEEVMKRRAQLRMERELMFREEIRSKRIKKIKSKAYRRVHRKEREKLLEKERAQLKADGVDLSEEEREYNDRRRAEERMGAKHRESKWAKGIKATGRAAWDQSALEGVTEMARRNEELRRRVEGKSIRDDDDEGSDVPSDEDESDDDQSDEDLLQKSLSKLNQNPFSTDKSKLGQMKFMQRAEATKRAENDEVVEQMRRELAGEDSVSEDENENAAKSGRRKYGPGNDITAPAIQVQRNEFEEQPGSDEETANARTTGETTQEPASTTAKSVKKNAANALLNGIRKSQRSAAPSPAELADVPNPFLTKARKEKGPKEPELISHVAQSQPASVKPKSKSRTKTPAQPALEPQSTTVDAFLQQRITATDADGWATILSGQDDDDDSDAAANKEQGDPGLDEEDDEPDIDLTSLLRNRSLTATAFAGDDVASSFALEKAAAIAQDAPQETVSVLPGWGAWTGDGLSKKAQRRNRGLTSTTATAGIAAAQRKDRKLDRVIISEKRVKPSVKYMASQVPFPFENREQYERSLRVPRGKEWTTKKTFQDATRPRVIVKQGVIAPLRKPLV
ncbi:hypothetical protein ACN47E_009431 [Coniothyrium glycines]